MWQRSIPVRKCKVPKLLAWASDGVSTMRQMLPWRKLGVALLRRRFQVGLRIVVVSCVTDPGENAAARLSLEPRVKAELRDAGRDAPLPLSGERRNALARASASRRLVKGAWAASEGLCSTCWLREHTSCVKAYPWTSLA